MRLKELMLAVELLGKNATVSDLAMLQKVVKSIKAHRVGGES